VAALSAAMVVASAVAIRAHEMGTTRVDVVFHEDRSYSAEVTTDATALAEKFAALRGESIPTVISQTELLAMLTSSDELFRRRFKVLFDSTEGIPTIAYSVAPGKSEAGPGFVATIRLSGRVPPGASQFVWSYGWTFSAYTLTTRLSPSENPHIQPLEGNQSSAPFDLSGSPSGRPAELVRRYLTLGFKQIVAEGIDCILFV